MNVKPSLTIGIPAYNEEANIGYLLHDLLKQNIRSFELEQIVVASDASSDRTDTIVTEFNHEKIKLIPNTIRQGQGAKQNQIIEQCTSDILVLLNADIQFEGEYFIENLAAPILKGADLVCGPLFEIEPSNFFEKVLKTGSIYRRRIFEKHKNGNNLFTCHGSHRAFSKRFYKNFKFLGSVAEDAYSYLYCVKQNFKYMYAKDAAALIKLPDNIRDHKNQSMRFFNSQKKLEDYFNGDFIKQHVKKPINLFITEGAKLFVEYPIESIVYFAVSAFIFVNAKLIGAELSDTWKVVASSKIIRG